MHAVIWLSVYLQNHATFTIVNSIFITPERNPIPTGCYSSFPPPLPLVPTLSVSLWTCLLWTFCVSGIMQSVVFLFFDSFTQHNVFKVRPCSIMHRLYSFYCQIIFCYIVSQFTIHISIDGHLCCFHFSAIMNIMPWTFMYYTSFCVNICFTSLG